jgi:hypothetical protein
MMECHNMSLLAIMITAMHAYITIIPLFFYSKEDSSIYSRCDADCAVH